MQNISYLPTKPKMVMVGIQQTNNFLRMAQEITQKGFFFQRCWTHMLILEMSSGPHPTHTQGVYWDKKVDISMLRLVGICLDGADDGVQ